MLNYFLVDVVYKVPYNIIVSIKIHLKYFLNTISYFIINTLKLIFKVSDIEYKH